MEEAAAAGVTEMIFVTGRNKRAIEDHFDTYAELERELEMKGKQELLEIVREIVPPGVRCIYIRQPQPLGLNSILNQGFVHDWQHFLRHCLSGGEKSRAETVDREYNFAYGLHGIEWDSQ